MYLSIYLSKLVHSQVLLASEWCSAGAKCRVSRANVWGFPLGIFRREMSKGDCRRWNVVGHYAGVKRVAVMICAAVVNTHTHTHTVLWHVILLAQPAKLKSKRCLLTGRLMQSGARV